MSDPVATTRPVRCRRISELPVELAPEWTDVYLTFDIDWACDDVLADTIDLVESAGVAATWFVTHATPLLTRLMRNPVFELGVHPNFNPLLGGTADAAGITAVMDDLLALVPDARVVRAHSMVQSSRLSQLYVDRGFTHECNDFIPEQAEWELRPWRLWNGLLRVPHFWEDDATFLYRQGNSMATLLSRPGLKVFDFHPIHVFLNTESLDRYERTRPIHHDPSELVKHRFDGYGTRSRLIDLLTLASQP